MSRDNLAMPDDKQFLLQAVSSNRATLFHFLDAVLSELVEYEDTTGCHVGIISIDHLPPLNKNFHVIVPNNVH